MTKLIVIGASAGGLEALITIVKQLPAEFRATILIVVHTSRDGDSYIAPILARASRCEVKFAESGDPLEAGRIYVAPPDFHLLVRQGHIELNRGPRENGFRPAIDPLFRTAARAHGSSVIGVILSGALDDGTYGMQVVKDNGGVTVVQDPEEASVPAMPLSVMKAITVDHVLPAAAIGQWLADVSGTGPDREGVDDMARSKPREPQDIEEETEVRDMTDAFGPPSGLTCPDCGGALWEIKDKQLVRYRCHVGHQFSPEALDAQQGNAVEGALWSAVRVLEEHAELRLRMARRADKAGLQTVSEGFHRSAADVHRQAHAIRGLLFGRSVPPPETDAERTAKAPRKGAERKSANTGGRGTRGRVVKTRRPS